MFHDHLDYLQKPPLGGRSHTKPGDHDTPNAHNHWLILFYHVWGPIWIQIHWISIWSRAQSHVTSHYTWGSVTTLHEFGGVLGLRPLDTFFGLSQSHGHGSWPCVWRGPSIPKPVGARWPWSSSFTKACNDGAWPPSMMMTGSFYYVMMERGNQCSGRFLGITGWNPTIYKSNQLHVHILWFSFVKMGIFHRFL